MSPGVYVGFSAMAVLGAWQTGLKQEKSNKKKHNEKPQGSVEAADDLSYKLLKGNSLKTTEWQGWR